LFCEEAMMMMSRGIYGRRRRKRMADDRWDKL
jgi:hypothetical protein